MATIMAIAGEGEVGIGFLFILLLGVTLVLSPLMSVIAVVAMWISEVAGRHRLARRLALVPLPFVAASLITSAYTSLS